MLEDFLLAKVHVYVRSDRLAAAIVSNNDYPQRVAHSLLNKVRIRFSLDVYIFENFQVMDDFMKVYPPASWDQMTEG